MLSIIVWNVALVLLRSNVKYCNVYTTNGRMMAIFQTSSGCTGNLEVAFQGSSFKKTFVP